VPVGSFGADHLKRDTWYRSPGLALKTNPLRRMILRWEWFSFQVPGWSSPKG